MRKFLFLLVVFLLHLGTATLSAQNINDIDFKNLKSENLSDQQVRRLWQRAQDNGYSISQIQNMAAARGMSASEINKLTTRIRNLQTTQRPDSSRSYINNRLRQVNDTTFKSLRHQTLAGTTRTAPKDTVKIFGYNLFNNEKLTFAPSMNIPTPENYQLGPGDQLVVSIWGAAERTYQLTISPEGTVQIANLGPIYLNGLSIQQATKRLKNKLSEIYSGLQPSDSSQKNTYAEISLGNVRSINVTVMGDVKQPGTYTLPSLATVFNALYVSGGPNRQGTFRNIEVIRGNKIVDTLDVYDFLVYGNQSDNIRLRDQDIIKVDPYLNHIKLKGETKRTGIFELKDNETLGDLLTFAGNFSDQAYTNRIKIDRNTDKERKIVDVKTINYDNFDLKNGDKVTVGKILDRYQNRIQIQGAVFRAGEYQLHDSTTVFSLIQRADGLRGDAFKNRALIYRTLDNYTIKTIAFDLGKLMQDPTQYDINLKKDDVVKISSIFDLREDYFVTIKGAVQNPGKVPFVKNMALKDLIMQGNGFKDEADPAKIEVARRITGDSLKSYTSQIARIYEFDIDENLALSPKDSNFVLKPFDEVFVRRSPTYEEQKEITVNGEVMYPGTYTLSDRTTHISDIIKRAGGLTPDAYPQGANLERRIEGQLKSATEGINVPGDSLLTQNGNTTKVGIHLPEILKNPGTENDLILKEGDVLTVPKQLQTVRVKGEVLYPISVRYDQHKSFKQYVHAAGGTSEQANEKKAYIVYANGEVDRTGRFLFFKNYPKVRPGATIVIPAKEQKQKLSPSERISMYSAIVSMAAIVSNTIFQITR